MRSLIDEVIEHRKELRKMLEMAEHQGFFVGYEWNSAEEHWEAKK